MVGVGILAGAEPFSADGDGAAGRVGDPGEIAATIAFLCSRPAGYINGEFINVDGGFHRSAW